MSASYFHISSSFRVHKQSRERTESGTNARRLVFRIVPNRLGRRKPAKTKRSNPDLASREHT